MCGFAGVVQFAAPVDTECVRRAAHELRHRGPDGEGTWSIDWAALSHRRLAIVDLAGGAQPMVRGGVALAFCGEIHGFRASSPGSGLSQGSQGAGGGHGSDTEFLLSTYLHSGMAGVERLSGQFGAAIVDTNSRELWLIRDRFGIVPLHYALTAKGIAFATEIKAVRALLGGVPEVDERSIGIYLRSRCVPAPFTMFRGIFKLPAGHTLRFRESSEPAIRRYWSFPHRTSESVRSKADLATDVRAALTSAVERHLVADVPIGSLLSGGIDSAIVAMLVRRALGRPQPTFVIGAREPGENQSQNVGEFRDAAESARLIGTDHTEVTLEPEHYVQHLEEATWHRDSPLGEPADVAMLVVARRAAAEVRVLLTGEGGDELFGGYPKHRIAWTNALAGAMPHWIRQPLLARMQASLPPAGRRFRVMLRALSEPTLDARLHGWFASFTRHELARLWPGGMHAESVDEPLARGSVLDRMLSVDRSAWLSDNLIERTDRMFMASAVEPRLPFLDLDVVAAACGAPSRACASISGGKVILREVARQLGLGAVAERPKRGFPLPMAAWLRGPLRPLLHDTLESSASFVRSHGMADATRRLMQRHESGRADETIRLWPLLCLELWLRTMRQPACDVRASASACPNGRS